MSGIKQPIQDILTRLSAIQVTNNDNQTVGLHSRVWNNQLRNVEERDGSKIPIFPTPAAFVEIISPASYEIIGIGFRSADIGIRIHLVHEYLNQDGTFEQDLIIFDLRDNVLAHKNNPINPGLSSFCPTACGPLNCVREEQDFDHNNLYHYILDFVCNFTDSKASAFDTDAGQFDDTANPDMDASVVDGGIPSPTPDPNPEFIIPVKTN